MLVDRSGRIWAMRQDEGMIAHVARQRKDRAVAPLGLTRGERLEGTDFTRVVDGVAVVPVLGMLMQRLNYFTWSYDEIRRDVGVALSSGDVRAVVLDIDSPGGLVAGCADLAAFLRENRSGDKPIEAFVSGMATSAAYWTASATSRVTMGSGSIAGSVGVVIEYIDTEPLFEAMGARVVRVVAEQSPNKRLDPLSDEGQAEMQALVDASCAQFIDDVAAGRGIDAAVVADRFGQGLVFTPADSIARGMADQTGTLEDLITELAGRDVMQTAAPAAAALEDPDMKWEDLTAAGLRDNRPDIAAEIEASVTPEAVDEAALRAEGAQAERDRLLAIDEIATPGHEDLVADAKADGKTTAAELALKIVRADKAAGKTYIDGLRATDEALPDVPADPTGSTSPATPAADAPLEERAKAKWDKDANLRAEFGDDYDAFLAWEKASEAGHARVRAVK